MSVAKNVCRNLETLARLQQEQEEQRVNVQVQDTLAELRARTLPCRKVPAVLDWLATYQDCRFRYKFLVLDGPSCTGKTVFARSLSPDPDRFLEVDCAGTTDPDLKDWKNLYHEFVLFDEASCETVLRYKKLFQASASWTVCGSSRTNVHAYKIWAHRVRLIIASNRWMDDLRKLSVEDAMWLHANSVYVPVTEPLFVDAGEPFADCDSIAATPSILNSVQVGGVLPRQ